MSNYDLSSEELQRYDRHIILDEIGQEGQQKLKESSVLIVGAGGLGSPVAYYLAAVGIGCIGIIDFDEIELSNLQRQILHSTSNIGSFKVDSAEKSLKALNPNLDIITYQASLKTDNVEDLVMRYDIVINCVDNFASRYLINDACVSNNIPLIEAGVLGFEGQVMVIIPGKGPCYRCIFPESSKQGRISADKEIGVLGAVAGTIGTLQATEAIKYLLGIGELLFSKLLIYDALHASFRKVELKANPRCPICGDDSSITELNN
ncbi:HesA/MoeB/ThiF family protein [Selenihalanaerobacter shriftii]|uniref:Adenylyltransferase and sulfurtransferase n=1 Tax=Selenihalanaerobacter shriftii TaxID=142842 RepID=A0A1T4JV97_9FIRM|nr:HesA/MoeB/ThiF family protein [Selenihalanaerobacter shriftii]SJZ34015.1 adenylyltransferase and sulfurtransferase [Selenihalanaerobacter shriftii]